MGIAIEASIVPAAPEPEYANAWDKVRQQEVLVATDAAPSVGFLAELRRRRVLRVVGFYAISVWLLLQVTNIVFPALYLPQWALTAVVFAIAAGFPIVAVLAWVFDITPQGLVRTGPAEPDLFGDPEDPTVADRPRIWIDIAIIGVLLAIIAYLLVRPDSIALRTVEASVAVLPFADMSEGRDQRYFSDGVAEELLDALVRVPGLKVAARTSSFLYREPHTSDVREIGERLGVATLLEGSVRRDGNRVRITAQLVDTRTGYHLWSESYDRTVGDLFAVQDDIARAIARALHLRFASPSPHALVAVPTGDMDAYDVYLRGRDALRRALTADELDDAVGHFREAMRMDPRFVLADAGLCSAYRMKYEITRDRMLIERALDACRSARLRNDGAPEVYVALGWLYAALGRTELAVEAFDAALRRDSANAEALRGLGMVRLAEGDDRAAGAALRRAIELDPQYWRGYTSLGGFHYARGRFEEALTAYMRAAQLQSDNQIVWSNIGGALVSLGRREEAADAFARAIAIAPLASAFSNAGTNYFFMGRFSDARQMYLRAVELAPSDYRLHAFVADACRQLDDAACETAYLRTSIEYGTTQLDVNPADAALSARLAWMYHRLGDARNGSRYLNRALYTSPEDPEVMRHAALVALSRGETDQALDYVERAVARGYSPYQLQGHPDLFALREHPRFIELLRVTASAKEGT